jgi:hypothetical protein
MTFNARTEKVMSITLRFWGKGLKITKATVSPYVADLNGAMML